MPPAAMQVSCADLKNSSGVINSLREHQNNYFQPLNLGVAMVPDGNPIKLEPMGLRPSTICVGPK